MSAVPDWTEDEIELLDAEAGQLPDRLTREDLLAASDAGWRRQAWRFEDVEDDL